jgi:hypothetical protein
MPIKVTHYRGSVRLGAGVRPRYTDPSAGAGRAVAAADVMAGEESPDSKGSVLANRQRG